jgi:hypothetical protein
MAAKFPVRSQALKNRNSKPEHSGCVGNVAINREVRESAAASRRHGRVPRAFRLDAVSH